VSAPLVGVLALQGDFEAHARVLRGLGAEVREVRVPADLAGLDGLVMPGGESTTMTLGIERERPRIRCATWCAPARPSSAPARG
jgi:glutamine amidotransferase PdxT